MAMIVRLDEDAIWHDISALGLILHEFGFEEDGSAMAHVTTRLRCRHATDTSFICLAQRLKTRM